MTLQPVEKSGALKSIRVLDLSRILAGPWASQLLADMGAEVIKVERPRVGDDTRYWGPPFIRPQDGQQPPQAAYFHCTNRNKKSIAIDITRAEGQAIIKQLIAQSDVLIENYKVGGLAKYGLDYQQVKTLNPELIYCSISGFGQEGPYAHKAGYDAMIQGEGGLMSLTGEPEGSPMKVGVALVDVMTGLYSSNAILAALHARQQNNQGQYIDISLLDVQVAALANQGMNYLATGNNPVRQGNGHPNIVPYQTFATQDGSLILAVGNDAQFARFCEVSQMPELAIDPLYRTNEQRVANRAELIPKIAGKVAEHTTQWWVEQLEAVAVPCGPVNTLDEVFNHPQVRYRNMVREIPDERGQMVKTIASPINLSETPAEYRTASPDLGQHTAEILQDRLGYDESRLEHLYQDGVVS